jgi:hypothetical protein
MATGRIGVTPVLRTRWSDQPTAGTTSLSGLDDNSVSLVYDVGYEAVYRNGVLLSRGNDYTATDGTTVTLTDATLAGDIIEIFANELVPLADAIGKGQYNAKGALLSATAASTPGVLAVGANDTVLTADSSEATGLKWATPAAGGMTLLSTTTLSGTSTTISSINQTYNNLIILGTEITWSASTTRIRIEPNSVETSGSYAGVTASAATGLDSIIPFGGGNYASNANSAFIVIINDYASVNYKPTNFYGANPASSSDTRTNHSGLLTTNSAITSIKIVTNLGTPTLGGTVRIYGVK